MEKIIALILVFLLTFCVAPAMAENITIGAKVAEIDKYGQAQLDISKADFTRAGFDLGDIVTVTCGSYIGIEPGTEKFDLIAEKNILEMLYIMTDLEPGASLAETDLKAAAEIYLLNNGMGEKTLKQLEEKLSSRGL